MNICTLNRKLPISLCFSLLLLIGTVSIYGLVLDMTNNLLHVADTDNDGFQAFALNSTSLVPSSPKNLKALPISLKSVILIWDEPILTTNMTAITGYKIEFKVGTTSFTTITADTKSTVTSFIHDGLDSSKTYSYQISAINSKGSSNPSSITTVKPAASKVPTGLIATAISPSQIRLSWYPPSDTFRLPISGYEIKQVFAADTFGDTLGSTNGKTTNYVVSNLKTDKSYSFAVTANLSIGATGPSNISSATPKTTSVDVSTTPSSSTIAIITIPTPPIKLTATIVSSTQINLSWNPPTSDGNSPITGYKIEVRKDTGTNSTLVEDTKSTTTTYSHTNLVANSKHTYKVYAINSAGTSTASNEVSSTPVTTLKMNPLGKLSIDEGKPLSFAAKVTDTSLSGLVFSLDKNYPLGAKINSNNGMFTWTPNDSQGAKSYVFDIVVTLGSLTDRQSITITVNDVLNNPEPTKTPEPTKELELASFVDKSKDPQSYVDRYNKEPSYKKWFDTNFPQYSSIYEAVGLTEPKTDATKVEKPKFGICGTGTKLIDGICTVIDVSKAKSWWKFW